MELISVNSKQISYVGYDDESDTLTIHYHTGEVRAFPSKRDDFRAIAQATNKYDQIVKMTREPGK
jgi:hypothetical protein